MDNYKTIIETINQLNSNGAILDNTNSADTPNMIFMLGIESKEVLMCRILKAILEPNGIHGLGLEPLRLFLNSIDYQTSEKELEKAFIKLEEPIPSVRKDNTKRRVDIVIHIENNVLPIEAKIWADDQPFQLFDYYTYYKKEGYNIDKIYYLTPNGKEPSSNSTNELSKNQIGLISFASVSNQSSSIVSILDQLEEKISNEAMKFIVSQFKEALKSMTNEAKQKEDVISTIRNNIKTDDTTSISSLFKLLKFSDDIRREYEKEYFSNSIKSYEKSYSVVHYPKKDDTPSDDIPSDVKNHARYIIYKNKNIYAYLCVDTNLYIVRKFTKNKVLKGWNEYKSDNNKNVYAWHYISYSYKNSKKEKWALKAIDTQLFEREINWRDYLD